MLDLVLYLDKMSRPIGECEIKKIGRVYFYEDLMNRENKGDYFAHIVSLDKYIKNGKSVEEIKEKTRNELISYFNGEKIKSQNQANELEEIALRIKENGLKKSSITYFFVDEPYNTQNLQSKTEEVGK